MKKKTKFQTICTNCKGTGYLRDWFPSVYFGIFSLGLSALTEQQDDPVTKKICKCCKGTGIRILYTEQETDE